MFNVEEIMGRVLLMDADPGRLARRCGQLTGQGWNALAASDLMQALILARNGDLDAAVLHVGADQAQGMDLPSVLRLAAQMPHLPVVILADGAGEGVRCDFLNSGADEIIPGNVSPAEFSARLRALVRVKLLQDELRGNREALTAALAREQALLAQFRQDNAHLQTLCATDPLTQLQNVRHFDGFLDSEFKIARRYGRRLTVLAFDLDRFKSVNDAYGHPAGDYVLKEFAAILKDVARDSDVVARTGGEEFCIVLPDAGRRAARRLAERIRRALAAQCFTIFGQQFHVTTSIGAASYSEDAEVTEPRMLAYFADQALLQAKQAGRDRVVSFGELPLQSRVQLRRQFLQSHPSEPAATPDQSEACEAPARHGQQTK